MAFTWKHIPFAVLTINAPVTAGVMLQLNIGRKEHGAR